VYEGTYSGVGLQTGSFPDCHIVSQLIPSPAVATDVTVTFEGTGGIHELVAVRMKLVTDGNAANRFVSAIVKDAAGTEVYRVGFETAFVASTTYLLTLTPAVGSANGGVTNTKAVTLPIPAGPYLPNWTITTSTASIQAGDQYSLVSMWRRSHYPDFGPGSNE
jgi:hypothetical protein